MPKFQTEKESFNQAVMLQSQIFGLVTLGLICLFHSSDIYRRYRKIYLPIYCFSLGITGIVPLHGALFVASAKSTGGQMYLLSLSRTACSHSLSIAGVVKPDRVETWSGFFLLQKLGRKGTFHARKILSKSNTRLGLPDCPYPHSKGVPRDVNETIIGGVQPHFSIRLYYPDAVYMFQTNEAKSYTVLTNQTTISMGDRLPQRPLPLWFQTKYPNLNWEGVPVK